MYKITLPIDVNGPRYGLDFMRGAAKTDDERIAALMKQKGFEVVLISEDLEKEPEKEPTGGPDKEQDKAPDKEPAGGPDKGSNKAPAGKPGGN